MCGDEKDTTLEYKLANLANSRKSGLAIIQDHLPHVERKKWRIHTFIYLKEKSSTKVNWYLGIPLDDPRWFTKTCYSTETSPRQFSFI